MVTPPTSSPPVANFALYTDGKAFPTGQLAYIPRITVDDDVNLPGTFAIELTGAILQDKVFNWLDDLEMFALGSEIKIQLGYHNQLATVFEGEITGLEPEFVFNRYPSLVVRGYDRRHRLLRGRRTRTFIEQKDSDIAAQIAGEVNLAAQTTDTQVLHDYTIQTNQTDWEFLQQRAQRIHYEVAIAGKTLLFRPVDLGARAALTLSFGDDLLEFYPRASVVGQLSEVSVAGWSVQEKQTLRGQAATGDERGQMASRARGAAIAQDRFGRAPSLAADLATTQAEADQMAQAQFNQSALGFIVGEGICRGRTDLRPGQVIQIDNLGQQFSGLYYVTRTIHRYRADRGYYTHLQVKRNGL